MSALCACSKCFSRHPFSELSHGQQLCKECRGSFPMVKCTYCRSEFQQESKNSTVTICKKCESMVKLHGKPSSCDYCNVIAAFIGNKCQRCTNSERKYGLPLTCEQCKQKCAFDRKEEDKKVDGKLLCWLCTLSYKRALAKTKVTDPARHSRVKIGLRHPQTERERRPSNKRPNRPDVTKIHIEEPPTKHMRIASVRDNDPSGGDHLTVITQLKEQIAGLEKQLTMKDTQLLGKERQMTELKASQYTAETEMRAKMKAMQREHETRVENLQKKVKDLNREIAALNKRKKNKSQNNDRFGTIINSTNSCGTDGGSSGTDSPSVN